MTTYHRFIAEKIDIAKQQFDDRMREYRACQRLLDQLGLLQMLDWAIDFRVWEDLVRDYSTGQDTHTGRFHITIKIPRSDKHQVHHLLRGCLDTVDHWKADYRVDHHLFDPTDTLVERWRATWDHTPDRAAWHAVYVQYLSNAQEGIVLSPTCTVQAVTNHTQAKTETRLAVVCSKPAG
jgi:hypothetical protein